MGTVLFGSGCSPGLSAIDRRTESLMRERAEASGLPTAVPTRRGSPEVDRSGLYSSRPATTNPEADALRFDVAGELAAVPARLDRNAGIAAAAFGYDQADLLVLDLEGALRQAQLTSREYRSAEEDYILAAIRLLIEQHRWGPRLFNDTTVSASGSGDDGRFDTALRLINELRATQRLPYGGEVEARWITRATENLREVVGSETLRSNELSLSANVPLLRGGGMVAREPLIQSERDLIYAAREFEDFRRQFLVSVAVDYFRLLQSLAGIRNQAIQLASLLQFAEQQRALANDGLIAQFALADAQNRVFSARASLDNQRESYVVALERFKIRLGLAVGTPLRIDGSSLSLAAPEIDMNAAMEAALSYRLDLQTERDRVVDSRRDVLIARNNVLPDFDVSAGVSVGSDRDNDNAGFSIDPDDASWNASATFGMPLDRRIERLQVRQAIISLEQRERSYDQFRDNLLLDVRRTARGIDLARRQLELAEYRVDINERRQREIEEREAEIDTRTRLDTEADLLDARNARDQAATDLRVAILNYLQSSGQLRVSGDGDLAALPGLPVEVVTRNVDYELLFGDVGEDWFVEYKGRNPEEFPDAEGDGAPSSPGAPSPSSGG
ncbi:MAG: TolC family protein [Phycisphaeraceae bacterium]|nr:TolC family protein [Phycisphaeraceae bacterium]